jgi:nucleoside-diphosphate-sugar epimerase
MNSPKVLLLGGTGTISHAVVSLAVTRGFDVTILNRGHNSLRSTPDGVEVLHADARDVLSLGEALGRREFDVVVNFIAFLPEHVQQDIEFFGGRLGQYIFLSSASAYQKPLTHLPITESTPLRNPYFRYSRDKIACEERLNSAYRDSGFPVTIIRPSHTYDASKIPLYGDWTAFDRIRRGLPSVVHGDGTSTWVLTHARDFAKGFVGLLGRLDAVGEAFHITTDHVMTWNQIYTCVANAYGVEPNLLHVTTRTLIEEFSYDERAAGFHLGDRSNSVVFDNSKIKSFVPNFVAPTHFSEGAREMVEWYDAHPEFQVVNHRVSESFDRLIAQETPSLR